MNQFGPFDFAVAEVDDGVVLTIRGEVDMANAPELSRALLKAMEVSNRIHIDCADLSFIDSSGMTALVQAHRRVCNSGGAITIRSACHAVRAAIHYAGLEDILASEDDVQFEWESKRLNLTDAG